MQAYLCKEMQLYMHYVPSFYQPSNMVYIKNFTLLETLSILRVYTLTSNRSKNRNWPQSESKVCTLNIILCELYSLMSIQRKGQYYDESDSMR